MEESLKESLSRIRSHKDDFEKRQLMPPGCNMQFQNGIQLPLGMGGEQEAQPISWLHNNDSQHMMLPEDSNVLPQRGIECSAVTSIPSYSGYFYTDKQAEIDGSGQSVLNELGRNACLRLELGSQYPFQPYDLNLLKEKKLKTDVESNLQEANVDYQVNGFEPSRPTYDNRNWASSSGSCGIAMFDEH